MPVLRLGCPSLLIPPTEMLINKIIKTQAVVIMWMTGLMHFKGSRVCRRVFFCCGFQAFTIIHLNISSFTTLSNLPPPFPLSYSLCQVSTAVLSITAKAKKKEKEKKEKEEEKMEVVSWARQP